MYKKKMSLIICKISIGYRGGICLRLSFIYFSFGEGEGEQNMSFKMFTPPVSEFQHLHFPEFLLRHIYQREDPFRVEFFQHLCSL